MAILPWKDTEPWLKVWVPSSIVHIPYLHRIFPNQCLLKNECPLSEALITQFPFYFSQCLCCHFCYDGQLESHSKWVAQKGWAFHLNPFSWLRGEAQLHQWWETDHCCRWLSHPAVNRTRHSKHPGFPSLYALLGPPSRVWRGAFSWLHKPLLGCLSVPSHSYFINRTSQDLWQFHKLLNLGESY